jgi:hypothetical protein
MTERQATYETTTAPPTEPTEYRAIGRAVFAFYGENVTAMIVECFGCTPVYRGLTYNQACEMAERIAKMMNGQAI